MPISIGLNTPEAKIERIMATLREHPNLMKKAITFALDDTAQKMKDAQVEEMKKVFNNPRPYTLNAIFVKKARGEGSLNAGIAFREFGVKGTPAYKYLMPNIVGGARRKKRSENALEATGVLPAGSWTAQGKNYPRDGYGDIGGGAYTRMLAELDSLPAASGGKQQFQKKRKDESKRFFVFTAQGNAFPSGIAERRGGEVTIMLKFIRQPNYSPRYDFYGLAERVARKEFPLQLERQWLKWQPLGGYSNSSGFLMAA
jgi:hypothetical protein